MLTVLPALTKGNRNRYLGGFACLDVMAGEGIDVEGPGNRCALDQVRDEIIYPRILLVCIEFGIFLTFPKAEREDLAGLGIRSSRISSTNPGWVFQDWEDLVVNGSGKLSRFSGLGPDGDDSGKHSVPPSGRDTSDTTYARQG
jgi:hypothetical protein